MSPNRRFHLGIDYGTSASKIVFRDYGAPGGEAAVVVLKDGSIRIPSRICVTPSEFLFADGQKTRHDCDIYESLKMRVATEVTGNPTYYLGLLDDLPTGFTAVDLCTLTVWHLISEGYRAVEKYLGNRTEGFTVGMTLGVPMAFYRDEKLRWTFLAIARKAWALYRNEGPAHSSVLIEKAQRMLQKHAAAALSPIPEYEVRDWIRSEAEAAMWWPFQSPAVPAGRYAKIDIGAGTTHASLFQIYSGPAGAKSGMAFSGAISIPVGMDAVDRAIADCKGLGSDFLSIRGLEEEIVRSEAEVRGALLPVQEEIYEAYRKSWIETHHKIREYVAERTAWNSHKIFVIGGGSLVSTLVEAVRIHPGRSERLELAVLEQPSNLSRADNTKVPKNELPFVAVAHGLSVIGLAIPEVYTPDEVPPMPEINERRERLDHDDIYAK
jgi:hypothetical protein